MSNKIAMNGGKSMNIRKNVDYSAMYARINDALLSDQSMMERYLAIGYAVAERPEKGAAVAAAEIFPMV
jgi:hypothetical protein